MATSLSYSFPVYNSISEAELEGKTKDELIALAGQNDRDFTELHQIYNDRFCLTPEYDQCYIRAKMPLDDTANNLYIALMPFLREEVKRERAERERLLAMGIGIVTTTRDRAA